MAQTRNIQRNVRRLQRIKTWQLVLLLLLMGFVTATFLRLNNIGMTQRREAVLQADKQGDPVVMQARMIELQQYVASHMNTDTGKWYLKEQYNRDSQKAMQEASSENNANGNVYQKAQEVCAPRYASLGSYSEAYQQCVMSELASYAPAESLALEVKMPKSELYQFSYAAPRWSPDFAGFSLLICVLIVLVIVGRIAALLVLKLVLKMRYRGV